MFDEKHCCRVYLNAINRQRRYLVGFDLFVKVNACFAVEYAYIRIYKSDVVLNA